MQVHGGIGFTWEHDAHLYWRRAKVDRFLLGDDVEAFDTVARLAIAGGVQVTDIGTYNLAALSDEHFEKHRRLRVAVLRGQGVRHRRAARAWAAVRRRLQSIGIEPGDRVVVLMMNTPEVFVSYNAIWRAGAVVTPILFLISPPELHHVLEHSGAKAAILTPELVPLLQSALDGLGHQDDRRRRCSREGAISFASLENSEPARSCRATTTIWRRCSTRVARPAGPRA